jgi:hypothetical protein
LLPVGVGTWFAVVVMLFAAPALAQVNSGSTGADGDLYIVFSDLANRRVPPGTTYGCGPTQCFFTVPLREPPDHIFNFTSITIGSGITVKFTPNLANTPVFMLASGNVTIEGVIDVGGRPSSGVATPGPGGPGGFGGGTPGSAGDGPGGGTAGLLPGACFAECYGTPELQPLIGGSGGPGISSAQATSGGGGGGALLIASSGTIALASSSVVHAHAGECFATNGADCGTGGAIRLIATSITGAGIIDAFTVVASTPPPFPVYTNILNGRIRLETSFGGMQYTGIAKPAASVYVGQPIVFPPITPSLKVVSIGGTAVPANPSRNLFAGDVSLPTTFTNPVPVVVEATNVPNNTPAKVIANPQFATGARTVTPVTLTGPTACTTYPGQECMRGTAMVTMPSTGVGFISAIIDSVVPVP